VTRQEEADRRDRFEELFRATRHDLLAYALRRTRGHEDAADVLAETYLIAWRKLDSIPSGDEARLWLYGVAATVERLAQELREHQAEAPPSRNELPRALGAALRSLPERQREVLLLTAWEGMTPREIAVVTRTPVNLVRVRLHRARAHLRRVLSAHGGPLDDRSSHSSEPLAPRLLDTS
jgi:RNA polymerase sigma factor (sigma-70 family)